MASDRQLIVLDGCTFFYSDENGDVEAQGPEGLFYQDVRHLSRWEARVDGHELEPLTSTRTRCRCRSTTGCRTSRTSRPTSPRSAAPTDRACSTSPPCASGRTRSRSDGRCPAAGFPGS